MKNPPYKCLFCLHKEAQFSSEEHPIPESLGNDDLILPVGFICDSCNQYFGTKIEKRILNYPPFSIERVGGAILTKKGKLAKYEEQDFGLYSTGYWDHVIFSGTTERVTSILDENILYVFPPTDYGNLITRFLLKMGLELLILTDEHDTFAPKFNDARFCARYGKGASKWNVGYGTYPRRGDLLIRTRVDEYGPLETRQIYEFYLGILPSGDYVLFFAFLIHCYACNLSRPSLDECLLLFNRENTFVMRGRW